MVGKTVPYIAILQNTPVELRDGLGTTDGVLFDSAPAVT